METETINKLFLELSQFATAKSKRELQLEDLLRSAKAIAERNGENTHWMRFSEAIESAGIFSLNANSFKVLPNDLPESTTY